MCGPADPLEVMESCWPLEGFLSGRPGHTPSVSPAREQHPRQRMVPGPGAPGTGLGTQLGQPGLAQSQLLLQNSVGVGWAGGFQELRERQGFCQHSAHSRASPVGVEGPAAYRGVQVSGKECPQSRPRAVLGPQTSLVQSPASGHIQCPCSRKESLGLRAG